MPDFLRAAWLGLVLVLLMSINLVVDFYPSEPRGVIQCFLFGALLVAGYRYFRRMRQEGVL